MRRFCTNHFYRVDRWIRLQKFVRRSMDNHRKVVGVCVIFSVGSPQFSMVASWLFAYDNNQFPRWSISYPSSCNASVDFATGTSVAFTGVNSITPQKWIMMVRFRLSRYRRTEFSWQQSEGMIVNSKNCDTICRLKQVYICGNIFYL